MNLAQKQFYLTREAATSNLLSVLVLTLACAIFLTACQSFTAAWSGTTAQQRFCEAIRTGNLGDVQHALAKGIDANLADDYGRRPLGIAAKNGKIEMVRLLLSYPCDVNGRDIPRMVSYSITGYSNRDPQPSTTSTSDYEGSEDTALMHAAYGGHLEVAAILIDSGAAINAKTTRGRLAGHTALFGAIGGGQLKMVQLLVGKGADLTGLNGYGMNPLQFAQDWLKGSQRQEERKAIVEFLQRKGSEKATN